MGFGIRAMDCHGAARLAMTELTRFAMTEWARLAMTEQRPASATQVHHRTPDPSSRGTKRSMGLGTRAMDCHGAARLAMTELTRFAMSEWARFAMARQRSASAAQVHHRAPDPSSRGTKRSMGFGTRAMDCHGAARLAMTELTRFAMSDWARFAMAQQRSASAAQVHHRAPDPSSRGTKRSMGCGIRAMDCHGAARLAMTKWALQNDGVGAPRDVRVGALRNDAAALRVRCPSPPSQPRPVIARNEAIHGLWHKSHGLPRRCAPRNDEVGAPK
jgi:hypothetical protein